jgi:DNA-directed RNA polymerase subunit beta'
MDPVQPQLQQKNVEGILSQLFGKGSPKYGFFHRRVLGTNLDMTGLSVITPNPSLRLNEVGLPEELAWDLYEPFIIRNLVQQNVPAVAAARAVEQHSPLAYTALKKVIGQRPVLINRAPTLHKYSILAMWPVLTKGHTLQIPPTIVKPLNADFDGDTASYSVPVTDEAVAQAIELMLPEKNLLSVRNDRPNFQPTNEYMQGLWLASKQVSRNPVRYFNTREDALKAYRRGDLAVDDPIMIKE